MNSTIQRVAGVVSTKWLAERLSSKSPNLAVLDGSWHMPHTNRDPFREYKEKHIPGAQFFGIDDCCDKSSPNDHMVPKPDVFSAYVGQLGIDNDTHVIVYDHSDFGIFSAQRVWWTFRVFGHNLVSVLDGGLPKWTRDNFETTSVIDKVSPKTFHTRFRSGLVRDFEDIHTNFVENKFLVVDARASGRFQGTAPEPREGISSGHMPGSVNIPFTALLDLDNKTLKSNDDLQNVFNSANVDLNGNIVGSCGTGISACLLALAAHELGKDDVAVYDGSWTEYAQRVPANQIFKQS